MWIPDNLDVNWVNEVITYHLSSITKHPEESQPQSSDAGITAASVVHYGVAVRWFFSLLIAAGQSRMYLYTNYFSEMEWRLSILGIFINPVISGRWLRNGEAWPLPLWLDQLESVSIGRVHRAMPNELFNRNHTSMKSAHGRVKLQLNNGGKWIMMTD